MTSDDIDHVQRQKRNREWIVEVTAKMERINKVLSKKLETVSV
jgi:hypothetical protein